MELAMNQTRLDEALIEPQPDPPTLKLHICRVCGKGFVSGCALGGHMHIHGIRKDSDPEEEEDTFTMTDSADGSDPFSSDPGARLPKLTYSLRTKESYYRNHHWMLGSWNPILNNGQCGSPTSDHDIANQSSSDVVNDDAWCKNKQSCLDQANFKPGCSLTEDEEVAQSLVMLSRGEGLVYPKPWALPTLKELVSSSGSLCRVEAAITEQARLQLPLMVPPIRFRSMEKMMATPARDSKSGLAQKGLFECKSCNKVFMSHQALGGHRASHRKVKGCSTVNPTKEPTNTQLHQTNATAINEMDNSKAIVLSELTQDAIVEPAKKKMKVHECIICHRLFPTGQALGGHKRCHWLVQNSNQPADQQQVTDLGHPLELFPAQPKEQLAVQLTSSVHIAMPGLGLLTARPGGDVVVEDEVDSDKAKNERKRALSDDRIPDLGPDDWLQVGIGSNRPA